MSSYEPIRIQINRGINMNNILFFLEIITLFHNKQSLIIIFYSVKISLLSNFFDQQSLFS